MQRGTSGAARMVALGASEARTPISVLTHPPIVCAALSSTRERAWSAQIWAAPLSLCRCRRSVAVFDFAHSSFNSWLRPTFRRRASLVYFILVYFVSAWKISVKFREIYVFRIVYRCAPITTFLSGLLLRNMRTARRDDRAGLRHPRCLGLSHHGFLEFASSMAGFAPRWCMRTGHSLLILDTDRYH